MKLKQSVSLFILLLAVFAIALFYLLPQPAKISLTNARAGPIARAANKLLLTVSIKNSGGADSLLGAASSAGYTTQIINTEVDGPIAIPANSAPALSADGVYVLVSVIEAPVVEGQLIPLTLIFENAGRVTTKAVANMSAQPDHSGHGGMAMSSEPTAPDARHPSLELRVTAAKEPNNWQISMITENFTLVRAADSAAHIPGEGHAHLYIDGLKIMRMYEPTVMVGALPPGMHTIRVSLNTHQHQVYMADDGPVTAISTINVE
jgi:copper(I)-binding protein